MTAFSFHSFSLDYLVYYVHDVYIVHSAVYKHIVPYIVSNTVK